MKRLISILSFAAAIVSCGMCLAAEFDIASLAQRSQVKHSCVARQVLAFYYPWYGNADVEGGSGRWSHWSGVDQQRQQIASSTNYPELGPYDSHDPKTIAQQCQWAKRAGVDGFIISWWGKGSFEDRAMKRVLDGCGQAGLSATIYYETVPGPKTAESAARDVVDALRTFADHPAWLKVAGQPVVFVYVRAMEELGLTGWCAAISRINRDYPGGAILVSDRIDRTAARIFDGIHTYNTAGALRGKSLPQVESWAKTAYPNAVDTADRFGRISTVTVIPGYDDTKIRKPGLRVERFDGASYRAQWQAAIDADPHWVLITSWNEWHEGSDIEPSVEYGDEYLKITAEFSARFRAKGERKERTIPPKETGISKEEQERLRASLSGTRIGLLPDADLSALWPLLDIGLEPALLTWQQVAAFEPSTAKELPVLVYASAETYRQTVNKPGDVDAGLVRYLNAGGCLVVLPSAPAPFHYNEKGEAVNSCGRFGLPISVGGEIGGWEQPPQGKTLWFTQDQNRLPHLAKRFPFPETGDLRWRPFVRSQMAPGDVVIPLVELRDEQGTHYGDAVVFVEHKASEPKGGKVVYAWFGLLNSPLADRLVHDLFSLVARRTSGDH